MRSATLFLGLQCLLAGFALATNEIKKCAPEDKTERLASACSKKFQDDYDMFTTCVVICSRNDPAKPYTPGSRENSYGADEDKGYKHLSVDTYNELVKDCGSHEAVAKEFQNTCGCYADSWYSNMTSVCTINLGRPNLSTGSVTVTSSGADTTQDAEPTSTTADAEDDTETPETTTADETKTTTSAASSHHSASATSSAMEEEETETSTSAAYGHKSTSVTSSAMDEEETKTATSSAYGHKTTSESEEETETSTSAAYGHKSTSVKSSESEEETETPEPTTSTMTTHKTYKTTTSMDDEPTMTDDVETPMSTTTKKSYYEETSTDDSPMPSTTSMASTRGRGYSDDDEEETSTTSMAKESTHKTSSTKKPITTSTMDDESEYLTEGQETATDMEEMSTTSHKPTTTMKTTSAHTTAKTYGQVEETSSEEYATPSHTKIPYGSKESSSEYEATVTIKITSTSTARRGYNAETSSEEDMPEYTTMPKHYNTTTAKHNSHEYDEESTTPAQRGYTTPSGYDDEETSTTSSKKTMTTQKSSTKTPMAYTTMEESSDTPMEYTKTAMPYQSMTTTSKEHKTTHPSTTEYQAPGYSSAPSKTVWTMDECVQPTGVSESYGDGTLSANYGCLATLSGRSRDVLCLAATDAAKRDGKWGQLDKVSLDAYKEAYDMCGEKLAWTLKTTCNCVDPDYTGPVPTDKPSNLVPETLPPVCTVEPCTKANEEWPENCVKSASKWEPSHQEYMCGLLCNKGEGGAGLNTTEVSYYWKIHDQCGSHQSLVTALIESCGCPLKNSLGEGKTCVYPRTGPPERRRPIHSERSTVHTTSQVHTAPPSYTAPQAYTTPEAYAPPPAYTTSQSSKSSTTSAKPPAKTYVVEDCPHDSPGKWPTGTCLDDVFSNQDGMNIAHEVCNNQCADFPHPEWPGAQQGAYEKAIAKCKSPMEISKALAKGCGCLNDGWVNRCRPRCEPPPGYSTTMMMPKTTAMPMTTSSMKDTTMTSSWVTTTVVTQPCEGCAVTTITTVVPCSSSKTSTTPTPVISTTSSSPWTTITYTTTKCGGCPETTVVTTVPCPVTLSKVKIEPGNAATCTTKNDIPQCTIPPGKLEGKAYNSNCNQWYLIKEGDTCQAVANSIPVDMDSLKMWNGLQANDNCTCTAGRWLCVGLLEGKDKHESIRYAKGVPTYSDYGPEVTDYDNLPKPSPRPYLAEPVPAIPETTVPAYR
ncbi:hypothetical protein TWF481_008764 [Arthrobotrys musiformis]|uniref:LysM domain-containing protein n=1 Tax=Arthrobotrys musiformis TaxID=47236 RepID=A0AAV9W857_9PEZI